MPFRSGVTKPAREEDFGKNWIWPIPKPDETEFTTSLSPSRSTTCLAPNTASTSIPGTPLPLTLTGPKVQKSVHRWRTRPQFLLLDREWHVDLFSGRADGYVDCDTASGAGLHHGKRSLKL